MYLKAKFDNFAPSSQRSPARYPVVAYLSQRSHGFHSHRRRRYKQIEDIRNFACTLEHFYDRLVQFESENKIAHE
jgi:hypothetical protein